jgi:hypothetical protein
MEALGCIRSVKLRMLTQGFFYDGIIHSAFPYFYQRRFVNEAGGRESVSTRMFFGFCCQEEADL